MLNLPFRREEYEARWSAVQEHMRRRGLEAAVVFGRSGDNFDRYQDLFYLTNYHVIQAYAPDGSSAGCRAKSHAAVIIQLGEEPLLVASEAEVDAALVATTRITSDFDLIAALAKTLKEERIRGEVGFVGIDAISAKHFQELEAVTEGINWKVQDDIQDIVLDARIIKSPAELDAMRYGGETISHALTAMFEALQTGASESEAAGEAAREVYRRGGHITNILISHGPGTADRMTNDSLVAYSTAAPAAGEIVRGWIYGAMYRGYTLDPGRTTVIGLRPTPDQKRLVESCADIVEQCRSAIRPGVRVKDVAKLGARLRNEFAGEDDSMATRWPLFGHGNGLFIDPPTISLDYAGSYQVFREGMAASSEAFLAIPGVGGAGFEQNFVITKTGTELLTTTPMLWW